MQDNLRNKIYIIGNGYDLGHGLPTSYKDFLIWYLNKVLDLALKGGNNHFSDDCLSVSVSSFFAHPRNHDQCKSILRNKIESDSITSLLFDTLPHPKYQSYDIAIQPSNKFTRRLLHLCLSCDWHGIEHEIYNEIQHQDHVLATNFNGSNVRSSKLYQDAVKAIDSLNRSVACLKINLCEYLSQYNREVNERSTWFDVSMDIEREFNKADGKIKPEVLFLNFNYTTFYRNTVKLINNRYGKFYLNFSCVNIHGQLNESADDIVFGIGDEQNEFYSRIERLYDDSWLQNMKSFHYFRNDRYQELIGFMAKGDYEIFIMGHSCSITDRTLLHMVFQNENCKRIHIFHHRGMESYLKTTYNIARNFTDKVKMREVVQPFNPYLKM